MRIHRTSWCPYAATAALAVSLAIPPAATVNAGDKLSTIAVKNFGRINDNYYRGAQPSGRDYGDLAALGVRSVIDLQKDFDRNEAALVQRAGMKFYRIPMTTHEAPTPEQVAVFLELANDPANQPVYVHCAGGRHRTGVMSAIYRMTENGWTADQAYQEMKRYKFGPGFLHAEFKNFLYDYYGRLRTAPRQAAVTIEATN